MACLLFVPYSTPIIVVLLIIIVFLITLLVLKRKTIKQNSSTGLTIEVAEKIITSAPDVIYLIDRNYNIQQVLNYDPARVPTPEKELTGKFAGQFIDEAYVPNLKAEIDNTFISDNIHEVFYTITTGQTVSYFKGYFKRVTDEWVAFRERNITDSWLYEQKLIQAKEAVEKIQRINQLILDHSNSGLVYLDTDFMVQFENLHTTFTDAMHLTYAEGEYCYKLAKGRSTPCEDCIARRALASGEVEKANIVENDDLIFEVTASPVIDSEGKATGVVLKYDNITIREKTAQALLEAKKAAETSDKLKSQFLSNMSHEIRTPLNAIVGFSDLLMHTETAEEKEEYISIIKRNNDLLLQLINDILDLSRIESDRMEIVYKDVDINQMFIALEASGNLRTIGNTDVSVIFNAPAENYLIHTEENRIQQVLLNFINNATKFTEKGTIEIGYKIQENGVYFYVSDTGRGIPKERLDDVFKRFVKLNEFANGTGLGLSICQTIIRKLGGEIGVESTEGVGSTFWFTLPVTPIRIEEVPHPVDPIIAELAKVSLGNSDSTDVPVLLIAEDETDNFLLYETLLKNKYTIIHAWNGLEAIALFEKHRDRIDAVVLDIKMPQMDGYETVKEIRNRDKEIPVIAASAYALAEDIDKIMNSGFTTYITKPIRKDKFYQVLSEVLEK